MDKLVEWIKYYLLFGWARGESISRFDEKRAVNPFAPVLGRIRIPKWVLYVLLVIAVLALLTGGRLSHVSFVSQDTLTTQIGNTGCFGAGDSGQMYVALDCIGKSLFFWLWAQVPAVLIFAAGFVCGWIVRGQRRYLEV